MQQNIKNVVQVLLGWYRNICIFLCTRVFRTLLHTIFGGTWIHSTNYADVTSQTCWQKNQYDWSRLQEKRTKVILCSCSSPTWLFMPGTLETTTWSTLWMTLTGSPIFLTWEDGSWQVRSSFKNLINFWFWVERYRKTIEKLMFLFFNSS